MILVLIRQIQINAQFDEQSYKIIPRYKEIGHLYSIRKEP